MMTIAGHATVAAGNFQELDQPPKLEAVKITVLHVAISTELSKLKDFKLLNVGSPFDIDWQAVAGNTQDSTRVFIHYGPEKAGAELKLLKEFLARVGATTLPEWDDFYDLMKFKVVNLDKYGKPHKSFDKNNHMRSFEGRNGILLVSGPSINSCAGTTDTCSSMQQHRRQGSSQCLHT